MASFYAIIGKQRIKREGHIMRKPISWTWIVLGFIIFWPIGLVLLFKRLSSDRTATFNSGGRFKGIYITLFIIGAVLIISSSGSSGFGFTFWGFLFIVGGFFVFRAARKNKSQCELYKQYVDLVVNHSQTSIPTIASIMGLTSQVVAQDLQLMINNGFFAGAMIDYGRQIIVLRPTERAVPLPMGGGAAHTERIVTCGGCGANSTIRGTIGECEYCGSALA